MRTKDLTSITILGFGNIGQAVAPVLRSRFPRIRINIVDRHINVDQEMIANKLGLAVNKLDINSNNYEKIFVDLVPENSILLNLATSISSRDSLEWAIKNNVHYLDTCIDPWSYDDGVTDSPRNTNYFMRENLLKLRENTATGICTSIIAQGANPGFVSSLVKQGLVEMGMEHLTGFKEPKVNEDWAKLACVLDVKVIQVSERDHQKTVVEREPSEFVNTWSVDGFVAEALQPIELGWGTHEYQGELDAHAIRHNGLNSSGVYFKALGAHTSVKSWSPLSGNFVGHLISHNEAFSLSEYLSCRIDGALKYRPTVYYAYHPCDQAMESLDLLRDGTRNRIKSSRVIKQEIAEGIDELGVFLISSKYPSVWIGSHLSIDRARSIAPHNNATTLQVVGGIMCGVEWIINNPNQGIIESEMIDHNFAINIAKAYWDPIVIHRKVWYPSESKNLQFSNFLM